MSKNQSDSPEFRAEAVKLVLEQGLSQEGAAKRLAIPKGTLGGWVAVANSGDRGKAWGVLGGEVGGRKRAFAQGLSRGPAGAR